MNNNYFEGFKSGFENCLNEYIEKRKDIDSKIINETEYAEASNALQSMYSYQLLGMLNLVLTLKRNYPDLITPEEYNKLLEFMHTCENKIK